jgi:plastocyanin
MRPTSKFTPSRLLCLAGLATASLACAGVLAAAAGSDGQLIGGYPVVGTEDAKTTLTSKKMANGLTRVHARYGPIHVSPGQNVNALAVGLPGPGISGYITRFAYNLEYPDGKIPGVDVLHLHHAVWFVDENQFPGGEEKTVFSVPDGYGWKVDAKRPWVLNHMIHNLFPNKADVYLTWDMDIAADDTPEAKGVREVSTLFMDVRNEEAYPVFDVIRGTGAKGSFAYPEQAKNPYPDGNARNRVVLPVDGVFVAAAGHIHPGGLFTDLKVTRGNRTVNIFRSVAKYNEPAGPVSWDMATTHTGKDWKIALKKGDAVSVSATYETKRASWYESMGIVNVAVDPEGPGGIDPFTGQFDRIGKTTHGALAENQNHGGKRVTFKDPRKLPDGPTLKRGGAVTIRSFLSSQGDLSQSGTAARPPVVSKGSGLTFVNADAKGDIFHSITSCKAPCNRDTGVAYPLADGPYAFDSGELGFGPEETTAAANTDRWSTPKSLPVGTYTYFCRIHPFMRGAFRVK